MSRHETDTSGSQGEGIKASLTVDWWQKSRN